MAAINQPVDGSFSDPESWQTLVADQRYRLFAAGNRRAAIAECLPPPTRAANAEGSRPEPRSFDARYGLTAETHKRLVLLTQVCRVSEAAPRQGAQREGAGERRVWRWEATRQVRPIAQVKSYIDEQAGSLVFFLTRSAQARGARPANGRERLVDSAVRIGRSLGLAAENLEALRVAGLVHEMGKLARPAGDSEKFFVTADEAANGAERCEFPGCERTPAAQLGAERLCAEHFIITCYERLDRCAERLGQRNTAAAESGEMRLFLAACIEQATALTRNPFQQEALERARLLDVLYTASDLMRHMRRSPRRPESIQVRLTCETPGRAWKEEVRTKLISRHGAMLECEHLVRAEDWLSVEQVDTGRKVRARMAWRGPMTGCHFPVALEFLDADNFWGMNWAENAPGGPGGAAKAATA